MTCEGAQSVLELDAATGKILKAWKTNQQTSHMVVPTPDEKKLYVANIGSGSVSVINGSTDVVTTIPTGAGAEGIAISPDTSSRQLLATIEVGAVRVGIEMAPDGKRAFVANTNDNQVTGLDVPTRKLLRTFSTGSEPDGMAWAASR